MSDHVFLKIPLKNLKCFTFPSFLVDFSDEKKSLSSANHHHGALICFSLKKKMTRCSSLISSPDLLFHFLLSGFWFEVQDLNHLISNDRSTAWGIFCLFTWTQIVSRCCSRSRHNISFHIHCRPKMSLDWRGASAPIGSDVHCLKVATTQKINVIWRIPNPLYSYPDKPSALEFRLDFKQN